MYIRTQRVWVIVAASKVTGKLNVQEKKIMFLLQAAEQQRPIDRPTGHNCVHKSSFNGFQLFVNLCRVHSYDTGPHFLYILNYSEWSHTLSARDKYTTSNRFVSHFLVIWSVFLLSSNFYIVKILVRTFSLVRSDCYKIKKKIRKWASNTEYFIDTSILNLQCRRLRCPSLSFYTM